MEELIIPIQYQEEMINYVLSVLPEEGCGLLAGRENRVEMVIPITNQLHSPNRFFMEPVELVKAFIDIEDLALTLLGIFHSHPKGPNTPSETDIKEFNYPDVASIILVPDHGKWLLHGFDIKKNDFQEIELKS